MLIEDYINRVLEKFSQGDYLEEVQKAKKDFFSRTLSFSEASEEFDYQMNAFIDWYIFDRKLLKDDITPVKAFVQIYGEDMLPSEREIFLGMTRSIHSLFEITAIKGRDLYVKDAFDGEIYLIEDCENYRSFHKKDIFQSRLIPYKDRMVFSLSFVFHPPEAKKYVQKQVKKIKSLPGYQKINLMFKLAKMKTRADQYSHIDLGHIYSDEPIL